MKTIICISLVFLLFSCTFEVKKIPPNSPVTLKLNSIIQEISILNSKITVLTEELDSLQDHIHINLDGSVQINNVKFNPSRYKKVYYPPYSYPKELTLPESYPVKTESVCDSIKETPIDVAWQPVYFNGKQVYLSGKPVYWRVPVYKGEFDYPNRDSEGLIRDDSIKTRVNKF